MCHRSRTPRGTEAPTRERDGRPTADEDDRSTEDVVRDRDTPPVESPVASVLRAPIRRLKALVA